MVLNIFHYLQIFRVSFMGLISKHKKIRTRIKKPDYESYVRCCCYDVTEKDK